MTKEQAGMERSVGKLQWPLYIPSKEVGWKTGWLGTNIFCIITVCSEQLLGNPHSNWLQKHCILIDDTGDDFIDIFSRYLIEIFSRS